MDLRRYAINHEIEGKEVFYGAPVDQNRIDILTREYEDLKKRLKEEVKERKDLRSDMRKTGRSNETAAKRKRVELKELLETSSNVTFEIEKEKTEVGNRLYQQRNFKRTNKEARRAVEKLAKLMPLAQVEFCSTECFISIESSDGKSKYKFAAYLCDKSDIYFPELSPFMSTKVMPDKVFDTVTADNGYIRTTDGSAMIYEAYEGEDISFNPKTLTFSGSKVPSPMYVIDSCLKNKTAQISLNNKQLAEWKRTLKMVQNCANFDDVILFADCRWNKIQSEDKSVDLDLPGNLDTEKDRVLAKVNLRIFQLLLSKMQGNAEILILTDDNGEGVVLVESIDYVERGFVILSN